MAFSNMWNSQGPFHISHSRVALILQQACFAIVSKEVHVCPILPELFHCLRSKLILDDRALGPNRPTFGKKSLSRSGGRLRPEMGYLMSQRRARNRAPNGDHAGNHRRHNRLVRSKTPARVIFPTVGLDDSEVPSRQRAKATGEQPVDRPELGKNSRGIGLNLGRDEKLDASVAER